MKRSTQNEAINLFKGGHLKEALKNIPFAIIKRFGYVADCMNQDS